MNHNKKTDKVIVLDSLSKKNNKKRERNYTNKKENERDDDNKLEDEENDNKDGDEGSNNDDGYVRNVNYDDDDNEDDDDGGDDDDDVGDNDGDDDGDCDEDDDIGEVKIQLVVMNNNIKTPTAKILTIQPASYKNIMEKINLATRKILGREIKSMDNYTISYKAVNARGPSNTLEDKLDF